MLLLIIPNKPDLYVSENLKFRVKMADSLVAYLCDNNAVMEEQNGKQNGTVCAWTGPDVETCNYSPTFLTEHPQLLVFVADFCRLHHKQMWDITTVFAMAHCSLAPISTTKLCSSAWSRTWPSLRSWLRRWQSPRSPRISLRSPGGSCWSKLLTAAWDKATTMWPLRNTHKQETS